MHKYFTVGDGNTKDTGTQTAILKIEYNIFFFEKKSPCCDYYLRIQTLGTFFSQNFNKGVQSVLQIGSMICFYFFTDQKIITL